MTSRVIVSNEEEDEVVETKPRLLDIQDGCIICGKPNAGRHYAVSSCCLGCKTFFRRAIIQNRSYFCDNNFQCDPRERKSRGPCAACRLNRCFLAGMTKYALRGRRDIIAPKRSKRSASQNSGTSIAESKPKIQKDPNNNNTKQSSSSAQSSVNNLEVNIIRQLTVLDKALRERKLQRFQSSVEARKLSCSIMGQTDMPFLYFTGLRIVDIVELAALTSMEMYSLIEWMSTLAFYPKMTVAHRVSTIRRYAFYQIVIETGYCTARSQYNQVWLLPNGTCMPLSIEDLPLESQKIVTPARKWRQETLYKEMTKNCIEVGLAFRRLNILPEELAVLKIIVFCECGKNESASPEAIRMLEDFKDRIFKHLFEFYRQNNIDNHEERFGQLLMDISTLVSTASSLNESFQIMRIFRIVPFDSFTEKLLFSSNQSDI